MEQAMTKEAKEQSLRQKKEETRVRRGGPVMGGTQSKLNRKEYLKDGYVRRFVNDKDGRPEAAYQNDYDFVTDKDGNKIRHRVGTKDDGTDLYAFLMEKPKDWYDEDQKKKHEINEQKEQEIKRGMTPGAEGAFKGVKTYQPKEGITITSGTSKTNPEQKLGD